MTTEPPNQAPGSDDSSVDPDDARNVGLITLVVHHSITVLILVVFLALGVWSYLNFQDSDFFTTVDRAQLEAELQPSLQAAQQTRLEVALEVYSLVHDRYPTRFEELTDTGLLLPSDLYYPQGPASWNYEPHSEGFDLAPRPTDNTD